MKALSIRAPWWWFILHAGKDIENRDWPTRYRGPLLIQASKWWNAFEISDVFNDCRRKLDLPAIPIVTFGDLRHLGGHVVGQVNLVDCVEQSDSQWFQGRYGFVLADPVVFADPYPVKGRLGLFEAGVAG